MILMISSISIISAQSIAAKFAFCFKSNDTKRI